MSLRNTARRHKKSPPRKLVHQTFLASAMSKGLKAVILDSLDRRIMANPITANVPLGRDAYCGDFLTAFRAGKLDLTWTLNAIVLSLL